MNLKFKYIYNVRMMFWWFVFHISSIKRMFVSRVPGVGLCGTDML